MIRLDKVVTKLGMNRLKIVKRTIFSNPIGTMTIFLIPLFMYTIGKLLGTEYNEREFLFPLVIGILFVGWFIFNFKFVKK